MEGGKLMIQPRAQKPDTDDNRRIRVAQCLVEIGAVLLGDVKTAVWRRQGQRVGVDAVEIPDQGGKRDAGPAGQVRPAVRGDAYRGKRHCGLHIRG